MSPKKRQPVSLLRRSDSTGDNIGQEISQLSEEVLSGSYRTAFFFYGALREHVVSQECRFLDHFLAVN